MLPQVKSNPFKFLVGNSINRRHTSSFCHTVATQQLRQVQSFLGEREVHIQYKIRLFFRVSIFGNHFHIFLFFLHYTLISELLSLDEGSGFSPNWVSQVKNTHVIVMYFVYLLVILLINVIKIYCYNI